MYAKRHWSSTRMAKTRLAPPVPHVQRRTQTGRADAIFHRASRGTRGRLSREAPEVARGKGH
eukprot:4028106-Lingulodinium_polyedra.AAC.1